MTDAGMFEWAEAQRKLAEPMSDAELAKSLLGIIRSVGAAESEFSVTQEDSKEYEAEVGVLREAAFRLAGLRQYE